LSPYQQSLSLALAQEQWPPGLVVQLDPCVQSIDLSGKPTDYPYVSGKVTIKNERRWPALRIGAIAHLKMPDGQIQELKADMDMRDASFISENPFRIGFGHGPLKLGETLISCIAVFQGGIRIAEVKRTLTLTDTPIAQDEDCLNDLVQAGSLKGLELRKRISELVRYQCVELVPDSYIVNVEKTIPKGLTTVIQATFVKPYSKVSGKPSYSGYSLSSFVGEGTVLIEETVPRP
jgi:hypothetical protein